MLKKIKTLENTIELTLPTDKSISHRAILFASLSKGKSKIKNLLKAEDTLNTLKNMEKLGVSVKKESESCYILNREKDLSILPNSTLNFGNSGTGIRLSAGLISGTLNLEIIAEGDHSLNQRPMKRIIEPLTKMGADIISKNQKATPPLYIKGTQLQDFSYHSSIASAQIKSCLIFAAISSQVKLNYQEPTISRDHTERFLKYLSIPIQKNETEFQINPPYDIKEFEIEIPSDPSSAMFFIVLGLLLKKGTILLKNINLNPLRIESIKILEEMGGKIQILNQKEKFGEPIGDLLVESSDLEKVEISSSKIPSIIDEIPILTIAGLFSKNGFSIRNAKELRVKESDRIKAMVENLKKLKLDVVEYEDGYEFEGFTKEIPKEIFLHSFMDHRIIMSFLVLKFVSGLDIKFDNEEWILTSFPNFKQMLEKLK